MISKAVSHVAAAAATTALTLRQPTGRYRLVFCTDIEGQGAFLIKYLQGCEGVRLSGNLSDRALRIDLEPDTFFVYGGDSVDRGHQDEWVTRSLVDLKQRYADRVALLIGNRDINKMRLTSELDPDYVKRFPIDDIPLPYWLHGKGTSVAQHLSALAASKGKTVEAVNTPVERLKYHLTHNMGCPHTFQYRQEALKAAGKPHSEQDVYEDVMASLQPNGFMYEYLRHAQIAAVVHSTLFVHGGLTPISMGFVPAHEFNDKVGPPNGTDMSGQGVHRWIDALNHFWQLGFAAWIKQPKYDFATQTRGAGKVLGYGHTSAMAGRTVMVSSYTDSVTHNMTHLPPGVSQFTRASGVNRVLSGHKPNGDCAAVMRKHGLEIVTGDTCYSDPASNVMYGRGEAVARIVVHGDASTGVSSTHLHGTLKSGQSYDMMLPDPSDNTGPAALIGQCTDDGWWTRVMTQADDQFVLARAHKFDMSYRAVSGKDLAKQLVM